jgi:hypothetical protein
MGILNRIFRAPSATTPPNTPPNTPPSQTTINVPSQTVERTPTPSVGSSRDTPEPISPKQPSTEGGLVAPSAAQSAISNRGLKTNYIDQAVSQAQGAGRYLWKCCVWGFFLVGVPVGIIAVANLPVPVWRQTVAQYAPFLLIPTYVSFENRFKSAYAALEKARQLIETPTSPTDFDLGEQNLSQAKQDLDAIPMTFSRDWEQYGYSYHWWYGSYFSPHALQNARVRVGNLEARLSQERMAQRLLQESETAISQAKNQYQQATIPAQKQAAQITWRSTIAQMTQIPPQTLAGRTAVQKQTIANQEFTQIVGVQGNRNTAAMFTAGAEEFAKRASAAVTKPPHPVARWAQAEQLWIEAVRQLESIDPKTLHDSPETYIELQKLIATYRGNLAEVRRRLQEERTSVEKFNQAQQELNQLQAELSPDLPLTIDRRQVVTRLLTIRRYLDQVSSGTTVSNKSAQIKATVNERLKQLKVF